MQSRESECSDVYMSFLCSGPQNQLRRSAGFEHCAPCVCCCSGYCSRDVLLHVNEGMFCIGSIEPRHVANNIATYLFVNDRSSKRTTRRSSSMVRLLLTAHCLCGFSDVLPLTVEPANPMVCTLLCYWLERFCSFPHSQKNQET